MHVQVRDVVFTYPGAENPVLTAINCTFHEGFSAILGDNGAGKTTLAKLISSELTPDAGSIFPRDFTTSVCEQDAQVEPDDLTDFALDYSAFAQHIRSMFEIDDSWLWRYQNLSSGQQKRIQIAHALWRESDVIILDEPSNHIDSSTRDILISALKGYKGIGILISHDRELLDALATSCVVLDKGHAKQFSGNYSRAALQMEMAEESARSQREITKREISRLKRERSRRKMEAEAASSMRSKAHIDPKDKSAKSKIDLAIYTGKDGVAGKLSTRLDKRVSSLQDKLDTHKVAKRYNGGITAFGTRLSKDVLVTLHEGHIPFDLTHDTDCQVGVDHPTLFVGPSDHIALIGPNGAGKSTLLAKLVSNIPNDINYLFLPQELTQAQCAAYTKRLCSLNPQEKGQVLSTIAQLNSDPDAFVSPRVGTYNQNIALSPGEIRKLALALAALDSPSLLILDEPTNHLDIHSILALTNFLQDFLGAYVLVTHDKRLVDDCCSIVWELEPGTSSTLSVKLC